MINVELREKFKKIYYEKFGISLTDEESTEMASDLINLMKVLLKPTTDKSNYIKQSQERREYAIITARKQSERQ